MQNPTTTTDDRPAWMQERSGWLSRLARFLFVSGAGDADSEGSEGEDASPDDDAGDVDGDFGDADADADETMFGTDPDEADDEEDEDEGEDDTDNGEADDKIIAVLANDNIWGFAEKLSDLPQIMIERARHYFSTYKLNLGQELKVSIEKVYDVEDARQVVQAALEDYEEEFGKGLTG